MSKDVIKKVTGPLVIAENMCDANMFGMARVSEQCLIGEIIEIYGDKTFVQIHEETSELGPGEPVEFAGIPMNVELGLDLIGSIYDDIQCPLDAIMEKAGEDLLNCSVEIPSLKREKKWILVPTADVGDKVGCGDITDTVQEIEATQQEIMTLVGVSGTLTYINGGEYTVTDIVAVMTDEEEQKHSVLLMQKWPVRKGRPYRRRLSPDMPLVTGQRIIDCPFLVAKDGVAVILGSLGFGKTVVRHRLAEWVDVGIMAYIGCGERRNKTTDILDELPELGGPKTGRSLMECIVLITNTSDMPVAAREASIYTSITIAKYFRDMGYSVALMIDSISRWVKALRKMSGRLEEMPGEGGYPVYLGSCLAQLYGCVGRAIPLGQDNRKDVFSVIGAASPVGGDISESATQAILHIVKIFWLLDVDLVYKRRFLTIGWLTSYFLYVSIMEKWLNAEMESDWTELRVHLMRLLQEGFELDGIAQLVGMDALFAPGRLKLEATRSIRGDSLYQNAFHEIDVPMSLKKQHMIMVLMMAYYDKTGEAPVQGVNIRYLVSLLVCEVIGRFRYTEEADLNKAYENAAKTLELGICSKTSRKEDF